MTGGGRGFGLNGCNVTLNCNLMFTISDVYELQVNTK